MLEAVALRITATTVLAFLLETAQPLAAASLCVRVTDPSTLPLADASVTAVNLATAKVFTARTDRSGKSCIPAIPAGSYSVEVRSEGFLNVRHYPIRVVPVAVHDLKFQLPFAEIPEGTLAQEATVSGTLKRNGDIVPSAKVCILNADSHAPVGCAITDDLGEYAVIVPTGMYILELQLREGLTQRSTIDLSRPGFYRDAVRVTER